MALIVVATLHAVSRNLGTEPGPCVSCRRETAAVPAAASGSGFQPPIPHAPAFPTIKNPTHAIPTYEKDPPPSAPKNAAEPLERSLPEQPAKTGKAADEDHNRARTHRFFERVHRCDTSSRG